MPREVAPYRRVFVALACPPQLLPAARAYQRLLAEVPGVRLLDEAGQHVTVIGPWGERDPDAVLRDFAAVSAGPLELVFDDARVRADGPRGGLVWLGAENNADTEHLWLQAWRAIKSHDPPRAPLPHVTIARFPSDARVPELPALEPVRVTLDRLCLYESQGDLTYRIIGEKRLGT